MIERCLLILHNENVTRTIKLVTMFFWLSKDPIFLDNLPIKVMSFQGNSVQCQLATSYPFKLYNIVGDWTHLLDEDGARNDLLYFVIFFQKKKRRRRNMMVCNLEDDGRRMAENLRSEIIKNLNSLKKKINLSSSSSLTFRTHTHTNISFLSLSLSLSILRYTSQSSKSKSLRVLNV